MPSLRTRLGALITSVCFAFACGPTIDGLERDLVPEHDVAEGGEDAPSDDGAQSPGEPHEPGPGIEDVRVPTPQELGLSLDPDSPTLQPASTYVQARAVKSVRPEVELLELVIDLDVTGDPDDYYALSWQVRGHGPDCGAEGVLLASHDTQRPSDDVRPEAALLTAIGEDLTQVGRRECQAPPKHSEFAPFGPGFWDVEPCKDKKLAEEGPRISVLMWVPEVIAWTIPWIAVCVEYINPKTIAKCESDVTAIETNLINGEARVLSAAAMLALMDDLTAEAMALAKDINLGFAGPAAAVDLAELTFLALEVGALRLAAVNQAELAQGHFAAASALAKFWDLIWAEGGAFVFIPFMVVVNRWYARVGDVARCYDNTTQWIAIVAAVGFGIRAFWPGNLWLDGDAKEATSDDDSLLIAGPRRVQSLQYFFSDEIVIDIDTLTSQERAATRRVDDANVSRVVFGGYDTPGFSAVLAEDVMVPEPWTLIPYVLAPAGTPIHPGEAGYGGPSYEVFKASYYEGVVMLGALGLDLNVQQTDENGVPLMEDLWAVCNASVPPQIGYCPLGVATTVAPWDIGMQISSYWRVWVTGGIIDPETGDVIEPEGSQFFVSVHASGEGAADDCYEWDDDVGWYVYNPSLPDCGPDGTGDPGGGSGGDPGGGDGGAPPPG